MSVDLSSQRFRTAAAAALLVVLVLVAYVPAMRGGWVWDDDDYVTANPLITAHDGLGRIWFSLDSPSQYFPLVYTTFRVEHSIWGMDPTGYHVTNIVLHVCNALLIWLLLSMLSVPGAWLAAAIWAVHPVQVESVAWVTERKNTLSTLFYLLSLLGWIRYIDTAKGGARARHYALAIGAGLLALFAKTTACTLPAAMLVVVYLKNQRIDRKRVLQTLPMLLAGVAMGLLSMWWEKNHQGTSGPEFAFSIPARLLIASRALWFYLAKLIWPWKLIFSYPRWHIDASDVGQYVWLVACIAAGVGLWVVRRKARGPVAAAVWFVAVLSPMLGYISLWTFRYSFVADHYQYLASLGPIALLAALLSRQWRFAAVTRYAIPAVLIGVLSVLTWQQASTYRNEKVLWRDVIAKNPGSWMGYNNLGRLLFKDVKYEQGVRLVTKSIRLNPDNAEAHANLGYALYGKGRMHEALEHLEKAVELRPTYINAQMRLGLALVRLQDPQEAIPHFRAAAELDPDSAGVQVNLGIALAMTGRLDEAMECFSKALEFDPAHPMANYNLANGLMQMRRIDEAIEHYQQAIQSDPGMAMAHMNLAVAYYFRGDTAAAYDELRTAQQLGARPSPAVIRIFSGGVKP